MWWPAYLVGACCADVIHVQVEFLQLLALLHKLGNRNGAILTHTATRQA